MFYVYIIQNPKGILYKGFTEDLKKRLGQHNGNYLKGYTLHKGPWRLVYTEGFASQNEARKREKFFKTGQGRNYLRKVIREGSKSA